MATSANWLEQWLAERGLFGRTQEQEPASSFQPMPTRQTGPLRFTQVTNEPGEELPGTSPSSTSSTSSTSSPIGFNATSSVSGGGWNIYDNPELAVTPERNAWELQQNELEAQAGWNPAWGQMPRGKEGGISQAEGEKQFQSILGRSISTIQDLKSIVQNQQAKEAEKGLFPGFELGLGNLGKTIAEGAENLFNSLGASKPGDPITLMNSSPWGMFGRAMNDPGLDTASKIGAGIVGVGSLLGPFTPVTMFGTVMNALGAHHDYDPQFDKDITIDTKTGRVQGSGTGKAHASPEEFERDRGFLSYYNPDVRNNLIEKMGERAPNETLTIDGVKMTMQQAADIVRGGRVGGIEDADIDVAQSRLDQATTRDLIDVTSITDDGPDDGPGSGAEDAFGPGGDQMGGTVGPGSGFGY